MKRRHITADDRMKALLSEQFEHFRRRFGRDPVPGDPTFFDPESDEPTPIPDTLWYTAHAEIEAALEEIDTPPAILYAFRKTRQLVTEENLPYLTQADLVEWDAAIEEYEGRIQDESDSIELCFSAPDHLRETESPTEEHFVADKLCLMTLFAYERGISSFALEGTFLNAWLSLVCIRLNVSPASRDAFRICLGEDMKEVRDAMQQLDQELEAPAASEEVDPRIARIIDARSLPGTWLGRPPQSREVAQEEVSDCFASMQRVLQECRESDIPQDVIEGMLLRFWFRASVINHDMCEAHFQKLDRHWDKATARIDSYMRKYAEPLHSIQ